MSCGGRTVYCKRPDLTYIFGTLILIAMLCHTRSSIARTVTSTKNGSFTDARIWSTKTVPASTDTVVINNRVSLNGSITVGNGAAGFLKINSGASLDDKNAVVNLSKGASLTNNGTLNVKQLNLYAVNNDPQSKFLNTGTATIGSDLSLWANTSILDNQGKLTVNGNFAIGGSAISTGTITVTGNLQMVAGSIFTLNNKAIFSAAGTMELDGAQLYINSPAAAFSVGGNTSLNGTPNSQVTNYGRLTIGSAGKGAASTTFTINQAKLINYNTGVLTVNASLTMNSGNGSNAIINYNLLNVTQAMLSYGYSVISNYDSLLVGTDFQNGSQLTNGNTGYMGIQHDFTNMSSGSLINNMGYIHVLDNFLNEWSSTLTGSGGQMAIEKTSTNNGTVNGNMNVCDKTSSGSIFDVNNGTIASTVYGCGSPVGGAPLPVKLVSFRATAKYNKEVQLEWATATEIQNDHFDIEKSTDGQSFSAIGQVAGHGNSVVLHAYTFTDSSAAEGSIYYYRLRQVDMNGSSEYSPTVSVHLESALPAMQSARLFPNPLRNGEQLHLQCKADTRTAATVSCYDMYGRNICTRQVEIRPGDNIVTLPLADLKPGTYQLYYKVAETSYTTRLEVAP